MSDPLADLGLDDTTSTKPTTAAAKKQADVKKSAKAGTTDKPKAKPTETTREEVEVGDLEFGTIDFIPTAKRVTGGSKYKFDELAAPKAEGEKGRFSFFVVKLEDGVDPDKLKRSVQSATTQANRTGEKEGKYFVSRSVSKDGKFVGMQVIRTDSRPD
jgi:hypothetical protein